MSATQHEAFRRFVENVLSARDPYSSIFGKKPKKQTVDEVMEIIEPFLLNPERHRTHIRLLLNGLYTSAQLRPFQSSWLMKLGLRYMPDVASRMRLSYQEYTQKLCEAQVELYQNVEAGEIKLDLLPVKSIKLPECEQYGEIRLIGLQLNMAIHPSSGINVQSLSIKIEADNEKFQFSDTTPSTRIDSIGSYELGISDTGKFSRSEKESEKMVAKMSFSGIGADRELGGERSSSVEAHRSKEAKITRVDVAPAVISAAIGNTAQWDFLRTPTQPLVGGFRLAATAFIPKHFEATNLSISALVQFQGWGPQLRTIRSKIVLPPEGTLPRPAQI